MDVDLDTIDIQNDREKDPKVKNIVKVKDYIKPDGSPMKTRLTSANPEVSRGMKNRTTLATGGGRNKWANQQRPGTGTQRVRLRSRTPNQNSATVVHGDTAARYGYGTGGATQNFINKDSEMDPGEGMVSKQMLATTVEASSRQRLGGTFSASSRAQSAARGGHMRTMSTRGNRINNESASSLQANAHRPGRSLRPRLKTARPSGASRNDIDEEGNLKPPGPASYSKQTLFPGGPKAVIQTKKRQDSMFLAMADRSCSPGPAMHNSQAEIRHAGAGSKVVPFGDAKRFSKAESIAGISYTDAGPGEYNTNKTSHLNRRPRPMIPRQKRWASKTITSQGSGGSPPKQYVGHSKMTERRSISNERNAPRATIGKYDSRKELTIDIGRPGPQNYDTISCRKHIGDNSSVKIPMARAIRPISAQPGMSGKKERQKTPGPADYRTVEVKTYRRQSHVIPKMTISAAGRSDSAEKLSHVVGPQSYKPNLDIKLNKNPSCTIGNTVREVAESREKTTEKKAKSPGPADYRIKRDISPGHGQTIFKQKRSTFQIEQMPGPQDYTYDPMATLIKRPRVMIPAQNYVRTMGQRTKSPGPSDYCGDKIKFLRTQPRAHMALSPYYRSLAPREKSPGPLDYKPEKYDRKRRASVCTIGRSKRKGLTDTQTTPGPGSYTLKQKYWERPQSFGRSFRFKKKPY